MNCFMFPGQPMAFATPLPDDRDFAEIAVMAGERAFLDLATLSWTKGEPTENVKLQVYGAAMSLYRNRLLLQPGTQAGHRRRAQHGHLSGARGLRLHSRRRGPGARISHRRLLRRAGRKRRLRARLRDRPDPGAAFGNRRKQRRLPGQPQHLPALSAVRSGRRHGQRRGGSAGRRRLFRQGLSLRRAAPLAADGRDQRLRSRKYAGNTAIRSRPCRSSTISTRNPLPPRKFPVFWSESCVCRYTGNGPIWRSWPPASRSAIEAGTGDSLKKYNRWIDNENSG